MFHWRVLLGLALCASPLVAQPPTFLNHPGLPRDNPPPGPLIPGSASPISNAAGALPLNTGVWTALGPAPLGSSSYPIGGRVTGIAVDPTNSSNIYVTAAGGGVWQTTNGGTSWTPLTDNQATLSMGAIAVAPSNHLKIYAGTGEANNSGDSNYGLGILHSEDGGATWTLTTGSFNRMAISRISVDPNVSNTAFAAIGNAENGLYNGNTGIYKTTDGGVTWTNTTAVAGLDQSTTWSDVQVDPNNSSIVYAAHGYYYGTASNGIYRSLDGGSTWALMGNTPTGSAIGRIALAIAPSAKTAGSHVLYAAFVSPSTYGLSGMYICSNADSGSPSFTLLAATPNFLGGQGWYDIALAVDPANAASVYAAGVTSYNVIHSSNSGAAWTNISTGANGLTPHTDSHALIFAPSGQLLLGSDGGVWSYSPSSGTWSDLNGNINTIQFEGVGLHPSNTSIAVGGSQDNGTEVYSGSLSWNETDSGDGGISLISQTDGTTFYSVHPIASFGPGYFLQISHDGGSTWSNITPSGATSHFRFYSPIVLDPSDGNRILLGGDHVWESYDAGVTWKSSAVPSGNDLASIAVNPNSSTIYISDGSSIWISTNDSSSWNAINLPTNTRSINELDVDPNDTTGATVYAVINSFNGSNGQVYKTTNSGASWTNISGNLPQIPVWSLKVDKDSNHTVYIATDGGVYSSSSPYGTWTLYGTGLPPAQGYQLQLNTNTHMLAVATHGRGAWATLTSNGPALGPSINIDSPSAGAKLTANSTVNISGWAIESTSYVGNAIASVTVGLDGKTAGAATYGINRSDVCAAYPNRPGCPNVGFSYSLSTANLAPGSHTITVTATDTANPPLSSFASLPVTVPYPPPNVNIDTPANNSTLTFTNGYATVSGWALETTSSVGLGVSYVTVQIDGGTPSYASYYQNRADVCAAYPGRIGCPYVGFTYSLSSYGLNPGTHTLTVNATDTSGTVGSSSVTIKVPGTAPSINIDVPSNNATVGGSVNIQGWALESTSAIGNAISYITVAIDGTASGGYAGYGYSRADVCAAYPGRSGCPYVGFGYSLNTGTLSAGKHVVTLTAYDTNGVNGSASVTINTVGSPSVTIDSPSSGATLSGTANVTGWAIESTSGIGAAISSVAVYVDQTFVANATYGSNRADVCNAYPGRSGCPNVGYSYSLNTRSYSSGTHTLTVIASDPNGNSGSATTTFTVNNPAPTVDIDSPSKNATVSGTLTVSGWALENTSAIGSAIGKVTLQVDTGTLVTATYGTSRTDVCAAFPGRLGCPNVGYSGQIPTGTFLNGAHTLFVTATDVNGLSSANSIPIVIANTVPSVAIDAPAQNATVSSTLTVSGWALENTSTVGKAIGNVAVYVDGGKFGNATYGTSRQDVCNVYPGRLGCPNVGYTVSYSGLNFTAGTHVLTVVATDSAGATNSASTTFKVASSSNVPSINIDSPAAGSTISRSSALTVSGWALESTSSIGAAISYAYILIDGNFSSYVTYGGSRTDVCAAYPNRAGCPNVGFTGTAAVSTLSSGPHTLSVVAVDVNGLYSETSILIYAP